jgi:hypothetical protein
MTASVFSPRPRRPLYTQADLFSASQNRMLLGYPFVSAIHMTIHAAQPSPLQGAQSSQPPILTCDRRRPSSGNLSMVILKNGRQYCSGARCGFCTPLGLCFAVPDKLLPSSQCSFVNLVNSSILLGPNWSQTAVVQHKRQDKRANETRSRGCTEPAGLHASPPEDASSSMRCTDSPGQKS